MEFVNIVLYKSADSSMVKVETSDENGDFAMMGLQPGDYWLEASYVGLQDLKEDIILESGKTLELEVIKFSPTSVQLEEAVVTAQRSIVEIKPDRTTFNVEGTINSLF